MSGGMNIAWSVGFRAFYYFLMPKHTILAWFIGGIIGAVLSTFLVNKVPKRVVLVSLRSLLGINQSLTDLLLIFRLLARCW